MIPPLGNAALWTAITRFLPGLLAPIDAAAAIEHAQTPIWTLGALLGSF